MDNILRAATRRFVEEQHLRNVLGGEWTSLFGADGQLLNGIRGRMGACAIEMDDTEIGVDLIEMQPGSAFPIHQHAGNHILYIQLGIGIVHIDGQDKVVTQGDTMFIPAEYPHGVRVEPMAVEPLILLAFGHPHKQLDAKDRMKPA